MGQYNHHYLMWIYRDGKIFIFRAFVSSYGLMPE